MSSTIQIYSTGIDVEPEDNGSILVTLDDVDAGDFVSEFIASEILDAMDFSDIENTSLIGVSNESHIIR